jgi:hypothetical protein
MFKIYGANNLHTGANTPYGSGAIGNKATQEHGPTALVRLIGRNIGAHN